MTKHTKPADDSDVICSVAPRVLKNALRAIAEQYGETLSSVVRTALMEFVDRNKGLVHGEVQG